MLPEGDMTVQQGLCQAPGFLFVMVGGEWPVLFLLCNLAILPPSGWLQNRSCKRAENAFSFLQRFKKFAKVHFISNTQTLDIRQSEKAEPGLMRYIEGDS